MNFFYRNISKKLESVSGISNSPNNILFVHVYLSVIYCSYPS